MENISPEVVQEMQVLEQNLQNILMQKQAFSLELNEVINAMNEASKSEGDIYKIVGQVMLKSNKDSIVKELEEKKKIAEIRIVSMEKQEALLESKAKELREEGRKQLLDKKE
ncbi:prefoldin subunit beta [Candidatus Pacearchaeota archaeon CG10_big_fil_rev_8_21_14_0_10_34_76]|nr:MAG: prefoldin subunit beta [Candidatus Pacearchaeota archaeon CG10_big_fil_rev_8_21_14_0_10_34_76]